jgi:hypothetical protein
LTASSDRAASGTVASTVLARAVALTLASRSGADQLEQSRGVMPFSSA